MSFEIIGLLLYLSLMLYIGWWVSRRIKNEKDFILGGRSLGIPLASFGIFATWFGAETCIGSSSAIYQDGLSGARADPFGYTICLLLMAIFLAYQLRSRNLVTLADLFHSRYSPSVEKLAVLVMIPTSLFWAAAQIRALGQIVSVTTDISVVVAVSIAAAFIIAYTTLGGLLSDVYNDLIQGSLVIIGTVILFVVVTQNLGGIEAAWQAIPVEKLSFVAEGESWLTRIDMWMIPILGSLVVQEVLSKVLASKTAKIARNASLLAAGMYMTVGLIPVFLGLVGGSFNLDLSHNDEFLPKLAKEVLHPVLYVVFLGALVSAILSTVDATLLSVGSLVSHNVITPMLHEKHHNKKLLIARISTASAGVAALLFALSADRVYDLNIASSLFGTAGMLVVTLFALYSKFGSSVSATACLITGLIMTPLGKYILEFEAPFISSVLTSLAVFVLTEILYRNLLKKKLA